MSGQAGFWLHTGIMSAVVELGPVKAVNVFAPMPGRIHTPRQSLLEELARTSLINRVLLVPSVKEVTGVPWPNRPVEGYLSISTIPKAPTSGDPGAASWK